MKIGRLFEMVYVLLQKKTVTASELAERFEISKRTVYRDMETLSEAGIPVYACKGKGGGIRLMEGFVLDKSVFTQEEKNDMLSALHSLRAAQYPDVQETLLKLGAFFNAGECNWVDIDFSGWGAPEQEKVRMLKDAVIEKKVICFEYCNAKGERAERTVEPLQMFFKSRSWYLKAYCREKEGYRMFKLTRIRAIVCTEERFTRVLPPVDLNIPDLPNERFVTLLLHISAELAYRVYDEFDDNQIEKNADGSFEVNACFPESDWLYGYLLSFGSSIRVREPAWICEEIKSRAAAILQNYTVG